MIALYIIGMRTSYNYFFERLSVFQEGVLQNIRTVAERVDNLESSTLTAFTDQGSSELEVLAENISELEKERISDRLCIDGLESRLNVGDDELATGEVIVRSSEDLKAHIVQVQGEASNFLGFVCIQHTYEDTPTHQGRRDNGRCHETQEGPRKTEDVGG